MGEGDVPQGVFLRTWRRCSLMRSYCHVCRRRSCLASRHRRRRIKWLTVAGAVGRSYGLPVSATVTGAPDRPRHVQGRHLRLGGRCSDVTLVGHLRNNDMRKPCQPLPRRHCRQPTEHVTGLNPPDGPLRHSRRCCTHCCKFLSKYASCSSVRDRESSIVSCHCSTVEKQLGVIREQRRKSMAR